MDGPRAPKTAEWPQVINFLNQHLRPEGQWSIADEYPTTLGRAQPVYSRVILQDDQIVSHALVRPLLIKTPLGVFKVAAIGSVVTSDGHRNQGLSTRVLESCLEAARELQCEIALLWTDLFDFYRRLGFELAGSEISFDIQNQPIAKMGRPSEIYQVLTGPRVDPEALLRLYNQHSVTTVRSADDVRRCLSIPNSKVATGWSKEGKLLAYLIEGKGADLNGYIHEWGGMLPELLDLVAREQANQNRSLRLIVPGHSQNLIHTLESSGVAAHRGYLGMMKILDLPAILQKLNRTARSYGHGAFEFKTNGSELTFGTPNVSYSAQNPTDILRLLLGPERPKDLQMFDETTSIVLDKLLPIPLWVWGWDSV